MKCNKIVLGYHVTRKKNVKRIKKMGLVPRKPTDTIEDEEKAVFLFQNKQFLMDALNGWLGLRIDDWEDEHDDEYGEVYLTVDITGLTCRKSTGYEWACYEKINPSRILEIHDPNEQDDDTPWFGDDPMYE